MAFTIGLLEERGQDLLAGAGAKAHPGGARRAAENGAENGASRFLPASESLWHRY